MNKFYIFLVATSLLIFGGCGSSKKQLAPTFDIPDENDGYDEAPTTNGISIHGRNGIYPQTYKDKKLGEGLFNHKYFEIKNMILKDISEDIERRIKIKIITKSRDRDVKDVVTEGIKYFKRDKDFIVVNNKQVPDVVVDVKETQSVIFTIKFISSMFESSGTDTILDVGYNINEVADESSSDWSTVTIKDKNNNKMKFKVMKNPVTISDFYAGKKTGDTPVTSIKYSKADEYCFEKFNGYVTPIYVFEYGLSQGAMKEPNNGVSQEMISGFDDANEIDMLLYREGDIVKSDMQNEDSDFSEILIFNYSSKRYSFKRDNFISQSVTFRCAKKD